VVVIGAGGRVATGGVDTLGVDEIGAGAGAIVTVSGIVFVTVLIGVTGSAVVASVGATLCLMQLGGSTAFCGLAKVKSPVTRIETLRTRASCTSARAGYVAVITPLAPAEPL
jgi:predicted phage tail protein